MQEGPTLLQRKAIGRMINHIQSRNPSKWNNWLWEDLENWDIENGEDISSYQYYSTLKELPPHPKRMIVNSILQGWNYHHDILTLYDSITSLIYLKVCNVVEYFLLQQIYNFLSHFSGLCKSKEFISIDCNQRSNLYTIRFKEGNSPLDDSYGIIDFQVSGYDEEPILTIVPWYSLLSSRYGIPEQPNFTKSDIDSFVIDNIYPLITNEFAKKHCPWINSNWDIYVTEERMKRGIVIVLHSLEYEDNNGGC